MSIIDELLSDQILPDMVRVKQKFPAPQVEPASLPALVRSRCDEAGLGALIKPGQRLALACGSRGIANLALITGALVDYIQKHGGSPFVVPAMGSHGGATAEGQAAVLESLGLTENLIGCPIVSSMETDLLAHAPDGRRIYLDRQALGADGIIVINRIKPHTSFRGPFESGLMKMLVIGLGKQKGAEACHESGFSYLAEDLAAFGRIIIREAKVIGGLGIMENAYDQTMKIDFWPAGRIMEMEPVFLREAKLNMPRLMFEEVDVLVVDRLGKEISGDGMDPNITGRYACATGDDGTGLKPNRLVALDLTDETHGCALGLGVADIVTKRLFDKLDLDATYANGITCQDLDGAKIPMIAANDRQAIKIALKTGRPFRRQAPRVIRISDTLHLSEIYISSGLLNDAMSHNDIEILSGAEPLIFDAKNNLFHT